MEIKMKKLIALLLCLALTLPLSACKGEEKEGKSRDRKENRDTTVSVCLGYEPVTLDPALNSQVDGATMISHLFSGLAKWDRDEKGRPVIVAECAEELSEGVLNEDGTVTYTYKLKEGLKWSDGASLTAEDYIFSWQRAASPALNADNHNMYEIVDGYSEMWAKDKDGNFQYPDAKLNCKALDERTIEITLENPAFYWNELLAYPAYLPVRRDAIENENWANEAETYVCNGPYKMEKWSHEAKIVLTKNENYHAKDAVKAKKIEFYLTDDNEKMLKNFEDGNWDFIDDVPVGRIPELRDEYPEEFVIAGRIGNYCIAWNVNEEILSPSCKLEGVEAERAREEIRLAVGQLLDRNYIVEEIARAGQIPASSFVAMGMTDANGSQFCRNAGGGEGYYGYYNVSKAAFEENCSAAIEVLKKYYSWDGQRFTDFPTLSYIYNNGDNHKSIAEYLKKILGDIGIDIKIENLQWKEFLNSRAAGEYSVARNGWVADYNDPICFLDMWVTDSGNNDIQFGRGEHAALKAYSLDLTPYGYDIKIEEGTWAETYDVLIATVKTCTDYEVRYRLMHLAEDMLMSTGCVTPLYFNTDIYMIDENVEGFFCNSLGFKFFMYCEING